MSASRAEFRACDTRWRIEARGEGASDAVRAAHARVLELEARLNAFDPRSSVARLNRDGRVEDAHVARLVQRADEYRRRTHGAFDVRHGAFEHALKDYLRGLRSAVPAMGGVACYHVEGDLVTTDAPLDLNGIAKGHIVDEAQRVLDAARVRGFVDGGGDIARPTGPVGVASPYPGAPDVGILDTRWNVATSGNANRRRGAADHIYDPREGHVGARHDQVTVLAKRDCVEADVLATTLAALPFEDGHALVAGWRGAEALWIHEGDLVSTEGFADHVWQA